MKDRPNIMNLVFAFALLIIAVSALQAQTPQPDLIVRAASITKDAQGLFVDKITVAVSNRCQGSTAEPSYVLVTFKTSAEPDAKAIYYVGNTVKALKGGQSYSQTFDVSAKKIGVGRHIYIEVDPYKKVAEASEDNNWRTMFPHGLGTMLNQWQCSPKM
jgi:hypothetical protein